MAIDNRESLDDLLSTSEAARLAGVTPSTMKRWADEGVLTCERTAGGHRRFRRSVLDRLQRRAPSKGSPAEPHDSWLADLVEGSHHLIVSRFFSLRQETGSWPGVADEVGPVLSALGEAWASGKLTIAQEHLASECLVRALAQIGLSLPTKRDPSRALLATVEGERHELGLRLAELCVRNRQWRPVWVGSNTPTDVLTAHLEATKIEMVVITASPWLKHVSALEPIATRLSEVCAQQGATLVLGGGGPWPEVSGAIRIDSYRAFDALLTRLG